MVRIQGVHCDSKSSVDRVRSSMCPNRQYTAQCLFPARDSPYRVPLLDGIGMPGRQYGSTLLCGWSTPYKWDRFNTDLTRVGYCQSRPRGGVLVKIALSGYNISSVNVSPTPTSTALVVVSTASFPTSTGITGASNDIVIDIMSM
jgi:hypothetical protein